MSEPSSMHCAVNCEEFTVTVNFNSSPMESTRSHERQEISLARMRSSSHYPRIPRRGETHRSTVSTVRTDADKTVKACNEYTGGVSGPKNSA